MATQNFSDLTVDALDLWQTEIEEVSKLRLDEATTQRLLESAALLHRVAVVGGSPDASAAARWLKTIGVSSALVCCVRVGAA